MTLVENVQRFFRHAEALAEASISKRDPSPSVLDDET